MHRLITDASIRLSCFHCSDASNTYLVRWAMRKYKRLRGHTTRAKGCLAGVARRVPILFAHWRLCDPASGRRELAEWGASRLRLLLEDVTLTKTDEVIAQLRFRGGATQTLRLPLPKPADQLRRTDPAVVAEIDRLLEHYSDAEIAEILNARGLRPGVADQCSDFIIWQPRRKYGLEDRCSRLRREGLLTLDDMATALGVHRSTVKRGQSKGQLVSHLVYNDKGQRLYVPPGEPVMIACLYCGKLINERRRGQKRKYCKVSCRTGAYARRRAAAGWVRTYRRRSPLRVQPQSD